MLAGFYEEVLHGVETSQTLAQKLLEGRFKTRVQVYIDAYSVYSAVCTQQVRMPSETSLIYEIKTLRDHLKVGRLARLYWIDTEDMVTDGLTKGSVNRSDSAFARYRYVDVEEEVRVLATTGYVKDYVRFQITGTSW